MNNTRPLVIAVGLIVGGQRGTEGSHDAALYGDLPTERRGGRP